MKSLVLIFALCATAVRADMQFIGFFITTHESLFALAENGSIETSGWLKIGDSFHSNTIKSYDRELEVLTLEKSGQTVRLHLRESKIKDGKMVINGGITTWPSGAVQEVKASLFLGEEQQFPLGDGVTLHLTATRLDDGTIRYHPLVVTVSKEGKESSDTWPDIITPQGGEFSLRVGNLGFSFKP